MRILIVDDSRVLQSGMKRALVKSGHEVMLAGDGEGGLAVARQTLPDMILLDMMLPNMSGTDVLSALKQDPSTRDIPVFVLSSLSQKNEARLLRAGAAGYFEKSNTFMEHNFANLVASVDNCKASR